MMKHPIYDDQHHRVLMQRAMERLYLNGYRIWMKGIDGQMECMDTLNVHCSAMNIERVQKPASYHHEELSYCDLVVFCVGS